VSSPLYEDLLLKSMASASKLGVDPKTGGASL
jgi:hypothetical protein